MKGYILNTILVIAGTITGLFIGKRIDERIKTAVFNALGLITLFVGFKMALSCKDIVPVVFSVVLGTFVGTMAKIEEGVTKLLVGLNERFSQGKASIEGFIAASILFCVGSMTIIGSIKDGLYGDSTLIKTKSVMDGFASVILASRYGMSVMYAAVTVFVIQGALTVFSGTLYFLASQKMMGFIDGVGGIMVLGIGLNLLNLKSLKTMNMLPSLIIVILYGLWSG